MALCWISSSRRPPLPGPRECAWRSTSPRQWHFCSFLFFSSWFFFFFSTVHFAFIYAVLFRLFPPVSSMHNRSGTTRALSIATSSQATVYSEVTHGLFRRQINLKSYSLTTLLTIRREPVGRSHRLWSEPAAVPRACRPCPAECG